MVYSLEDRSPFCVAINCITTNDLVLLQHQKCTGFFISQACSPHACSWGHPAARGLPIRAVGGLGSEAATEGVQEPGMHGRELGPGVGYPGCQAGGQTRPQNRHWDEQLRPVRRICTLQSFCSLYHRPAFFMGLCITNFHFWSLYH